MAFISNLLTEIKFIIKVIMKWIFGTFLLIVSLCQQYDWSKV